MDWRRIHEPGAGNIPEALTSLTLIRLWTKLNTARLLGPTNILRVLIYRAGLRTGTHPACRARFQLPSAPFFTKPALAVKGEETDAREIRTPRLFGWLELPLSSGPPDWYLNVLTGRRSESKSIDWWQIPDF